VRDCALLAGLALVLAAGSCYAAETQSTGKIICWSDKNGKVIGCGDKVPPEYQDSATRELSKRGIVIQQTGPAPTAEQKRAQQAELERKKAEQAKEQEQRRRDKALLETFTDEKEIELKRGRDIQLLEDQIEILQANLKAATERYNHANSRGTQLAKNKQPVPGNIQDEIDRAGADKSRFERQIAEKRSEIKETNQRSDEIKQRFRELRGEQVLPAADRRPH
jgi:DNA repair exonuclease SbcCD ATPase subunit